MDQYANILLSFPPQGDDPIVDNEDYHKTAQLHVQLLEDMLKEHTRDLVTCSTELLNVVDPAVNSLSHLTILHALVFPSLASTVPQEFILEQVVTFMMTFDGRQCRYAGSLLLNLMEAVGNGRLLPPTVAVEALATAILRLEPAGTLLTSSHVLLARLAYETNNIQPALPVIDKPIVFYPGMVHHDASRLLCDPDLPPFLYISKDTGLTAPLKSPIVLEYDLLCGMMFCARRDWDKARIAFERVVSYPTKSDGCSKLMVDAYKKWILVSLLASGRHTTAPPHTITSTVKTFETLAGPYLNLATAFTTDDVQQLKLEAEKNTQLWIEDGNVGMLAEVMASYQKWRIVSLQQTYTKISMSEIRQQTKSAGTGAALDRDEDVEKLLENMIEAGMLKGAIEKSDNGMKFLIFLSPSTNLSEEEFENEIQRATANIKQLQLIHRATNLRLGTSKEYIKWAMRETVRDNKREWPEDLTLGFDAKVDDEDLMGGLTTI
ncbi:cop9 subunit [Xylaria intraflava]|nr:cop9 subunit [Xylaria intraflava]